MKDKNSSSAIGISISRFARRAYILQPRVTPWEKSKPKHHYPERAASSRSRRKERTILSQSLARLYVHIIFSTKNRFPLLQDKGVRNEMHSYLGGACNKLDSPVLTVGGAADHAHILCALSKNVSVAKLVGEIKRE